MAGERYFLSEPLVDSVMNIGQKRTVEERDYCTLDDILCAQIQLEEEAQHNIKEKWGEEGVCTYSQGYMSQNIFACETCQNEEGNQSSFGFCYGCSMQCHVNHNVYELFNKRNFRCDCGLDKCGTCQLDSKTESSKNLENQYNHNFQGLYCFCNKEYNPDTDEMLQCYICQDWFHVECVEKASRAAFPANLLIENPEKKTETEEYLFVPIDREDGNMICISCMDANAFLYHYAFNSRLPPSILNLGLKEEVINREATECQLPRIENSKTFPSFSTFWPPGWRKSLCKCTECHKIYSEKNIQFLVEEEEEEDTEADVEEQPDSSVDLEAAAMSKFSQEFSHEQQIDILRGFNMLTDELRDYLKPFRESGTVVTREHIEQFFEKMHQKRRKTE